MSYNMTMPGTATIKGNIASSSPVQAGTMTIHPYFHVNRGVETMTKSLAADRGLLRNNMHIKNSEPNFFAKLMPWILMPLGAKSHNLKNLNMGRSVVWTDQRFFELVRDGYKHYEFQAPAPSAAFMEFRENTIIESMFATKH